MKNAEDYWPCQRLRLAFGCLLFFLFEMSLGKKLPPILTWMIFSVGVGSFMSALLALRTYKLRYQIELIQKALKERPAQP